MHDELKDDLRPRRWWVSGMSSSLPGQIRVEQSCRRLDRLRASIEGWVARRREADQVKQYDTQLTVLGGALSGSVSDLRRVVEAIPHSEAVGLVYRLCRTVDTRAELVRKVFDYYRSKFDQRDDPVLGPMLRAADEVVWSCWAEPFRNAQRHNPNLVIGPAPLPYVEPQYSPAAIPRDDPPAGLIAGRDDHVLAAYLNRLPVPIITLPAVTVDDPWWLICVGHEVGHHLQYDLTGQFRLVGTFGRGVEAASKAAGAAEPTQWRNWSQEIFADICSVLSMGPFAVYAIVQLELDEEERMLKGARAKYPPPLVRIGALAEVARCLGVDPGPALWPVELRRFTDGDSPSTSAWAEIVRTFAVGYPVARAALADPLDGYGPFEKLFDWQPSRFAPRGTAWNMREGLLGRAPLTVNPRLRSARLLTSAATAAWMEIATVEDPGQREENRMALARDYLSAVLRSREEGTRAVNAVDQPNIAALTDDLSRLLIESVPSDGPAQFDEER